MPARESRLQQLGLAWMLHIQASMKMKALIRVCLMLALLTCPLLATAGTEARLSSGTSEKRLEIRNYKRGLFFGSCGISTRSLQWEYSFRLKGPGLVYAVDAITMQDGSLKNIPLSAGEIKLEAKRVSLNLKIKQAGMENPFPHNGTYKLTLLPKV